MNLLNRTTLKGGSGGRPSRTFPTSNVSSVFKAGGLNGYGTVNLGNVPFLAPLTGIASRAVGRPFGSAPRLASSAFHTNAAGRRGVIKGMPTTGFGDHITSAVHLTGNGIHATLRRKVLRGS